MKQTVSRCNRDHRHIILTVPGSLWSYFHNAEMLKLLADCGVRLIKEVVSTCLKGKELELGVILVIQTAGRKSTWNPHLHLLVTEGGLDTDQHWQRFYYFDYQILRKKWMYILLNALKKALANDSEALGLLEEVFQKRGAVGFIVRAKREEIRKRDIISYLIKYVVAPAIAPDGHRGGYNGRYVEYWYREHPTDRQVFTRVSVYEFMARLIQHIPGKGLKLIRHYGLYARVKIKKAKEIIDKIFKYVKTISQGFVSLVTASVGSNYRERLVNSFGVDPLRCSECGQELILYEVWHPKYGAVYRNDNWRDEITIECCEENVGEENESGRESYYLSLPEMSISN